MYLQAHPSAITELDVGASAHIEPQAARALVTAILGSSVRSMSGIHIPQPSTPGEKERKEKEKGHALASPGGLIMRCMQLNLGATEAILLGNLLGGNVGLSPLSLPPTKLQHVSLSVSSACCDCAFCAFLVVRLLHWSSTTAALSTSRLDSSCPYPVQLRPGRCTCLPS